MSAALRPVAALAGLFAALGCVDAAPTIAPENVQSEPSAVTSLRGTVDLVAGTLTFEPVSPRPGAIVGSSDVSPAIYGNQGQTVRIYQSTVVITNPSAPGKKSFSADVGVRNLLTYPIGDEQGQTFPTDTTGIFVFVNGGPTVTRTSSPCSPACSVTVANSAGRKTFNAANQFYWYWNDRLTAVNGGRDTTLTRRRWAFEADTQVTGFTFDVLLDAAWPAPHQTRWKVEFTGDSLPHATAEPDWERFLLLGTGTVGPDAANPGSVLITVPSNGSQHFLRRDSIGSATNAYMEARLVVNQGNPKPDIGFVIDDDVRSIAVGLSSKDVGFVDAAQNFLGTPVAVSANSFQTYRIRKFAADSVQLLVNGTRVASRAYSGFALSNARLFPYFQFGVPGQAPGPNSSTWDYVVYEIGVTAP